MRTYKKHLKKKVSSTDKVSTENQLKFLGSNGSVEKNSQISVLSFGQKPSLKHYSTSAMANLYLYAFFYLCHLA